MGTWKNPLLLKIFRVRLATLPYRKTKRVYPYGVQVRPTLVSEITDYLITNIHLAYDKMKSNERKRFTL